MSLSAGFFSIPTALFFEFEGRDSERYLHNRLTNNIRALSKGGSCLAAALTPQGKAQGLFAVVKHPELPRFLLQCDGGERDEILAGLLRFKVADRVDVHDLTEELKLLHVYGAPPPTLPSPASASDSMDRWWIALTRARTAGQGIDLIVPRTRVQELGEQLERSGYKEASQEERALLRVQGGLPEFPSEVSPSMLFAEAGLTLAVSFTKGCYVGQEVLERIDSHGSLPRIFVRIKVEGEHLLTPGAPVWERSESTNELARTSHEKLEVRASAPSMARSDCSREQSGAPTEATADHERSRLGRVVKGAIDSMSGSTWCFASVRASWLDQELKRAGDRLQVIVDGHPGEIHQILGKD